MTRARIADAVGILLAAVALWATVQTLGAPIMRYDEGLLLTHSQMVLGGAVPHRDFYTNYPPGIYLAIAGLWKWTGQTPWALRYLGLGLHLAVALLLGRLAGRALSRAFCPLAFGLVLLWLLPLQTVPYAWLAGLAMALAALELWLGARHFACGVAFAGIACFRHDLFAYLAACLAALALVSRTPLPRGRRAIALAAGAALPLLFVWVPLLARAGFEPVLRDLVLDQIRYVSAARRLPLPSLVDAPGALPAFLVDFFPGAVALALAGPALALVALAARLASPAAAALLGALCLAVLPQMLGRTDSIHALFSAVPALALAVVLLRCLGKRVRPAALGGALLLVGVILLALPLRTRLLLRPLAPIALPTGPPPYHGIPVTRDQARAIAWVARHTRPDEPIYVGLADHRRMVSNEVDFYYFAGRPGSTRYLQFDPGLVTREEVQREMIAELEAKRTRLAVLVQCCWREEPNQSQRLGAGALDRYLRRHFEPAKHFGRYLVAVRRGERSEALEDRAGPEPSAAAHGDEAVAGSAALELVERGRDEARARAAGRVAEGDGTAVRVHALGIGGELLLPGQHHRGKGLVHLADGQVLHAEARALEELVGGGDRPLEHAHRVATHQHRIYDSRARPHAQARQARLRGEQHGGGPVRDL
jgi:hypothetical protein